MTDILVIGGGLSGLFSACLAVNKGYQTTLVMSGRGGLSLTHGAIELLARASPSRSIAQLSTPHPYALAGKKHLVAGIKAFLEVISDQGLPYSGGRSSNRKILSASGNHLLAAYVPPGYLAADGDAADDPVTLGSFAALRDFKPAYIQANLKKGGRQSSRHIELPLLHPFTGRDLYALDIAHMFDDLDWTVENVRAWKPHLVGAKKLGLPGVLGYTNHLEVLNLLEDMLSIPVFEIPTLPPSIPGLRLEKALRGFLDKHGVRVIEGPHATGRVRRYKGAARAAGALLDANGRPYILESRSVILATGSFLHGGLIAAQNHSIHESVFNIPVDYSGNRTEWVEEHTYDPQAYARFGISVNNSMQPLDIHDEPYLDNLFAVGGIIKGSDRTNEASRQGIDIATSHCAMENLARSLA